ncbi:hypothetical protein ACLOJK_031658 [Asimina triloba]
MLVFSLQLLGPVVVSLLRDAMNGCPPLETEITSRMLFKDAAYSAAGHVYYELSSYLNFKEWFNGALSLELSNDHPNMRIIHRKIAMILGQWVSEVKGDMRRPVYCALIRLLQDNDLAVRLAACRSVCFLIQEVNFYVQDFSELLPTCWALCFKLVEEVQEFDSKVQVLNLISVLLEHVGEHIAPFANKLVEFFEKVWEESTGESLLQIQLLVSLRNFVVALGYQSTIAHNMLFPILQRGIDINNPDELNLLEDSILLWDATLSHAPSMVPQLLEFFPHLVTIIERNFDHLQIAVSILESYIVLGGSEFLNIHASSVAKLLDCIVGNVNDKGLLSTLPIIEILVQCFPMEVPPLIGGTLQKLILICLGGGDDHDPSKSAVKASTGAVLGRILVMNTHFLACLTSEQSLSLALQQAGVSINQNIILCVLLNIDSVMAIHKKIYALALSITLTLRMPQVLDKLDEILRCNSDSLAITVFLRIRASDPIKQLSLETMLKENLQSCAAIHGESAFNAALSRIDQAAFAQLQKALKMV